MIPRKEENALLEDDFSLFHKLNFDKIQKVLSNVVKLPDLKQK